MNFRQNYSVLIIDNQPIIIDTYIKVLENIKSQLENLQFDITSFCNTDEASDFLKKINPSYKFDLVISEVNMPASIDRHILSGEDFGVKIKKKWPNARIVYITSVSNKYRLSNILCELNPDGVILKSDISIKELIEGLKQIVLNRPFFSYTITNLLRRDFISDINLDKLDRQILYELSNGARTKDLPMVIPKSLAAIERRKMKMKKVFGVEKESDYELLKLAREFEFI